jgi:DNA-binding NarL/FixJ family response regulator
MIEATKPDLAIVDLALKNSNGLELIKDIVALHPNIRTLVVSMHDELVNAERVVRAGAGGYITKQEATTKILQAVRCVLDGGIYLSEQAAAQIVSRVAGRPRRKEGIAVDNLTDRELQVFELIGHGLSTRQIAEQLSLDISTVETYRSRIKEKLNLQDAPELLQCAIRWNSSFRV